MAINSISRDYHCFWKNKLCNLSPSSNVFKEIKNISSYKNREQLPNVLYNSEDKENTQYSTDAEKAEKFADHFESVYKLTNSKISSIEDSANMIYHLYSSNQQKITNFSNDCTALLKENETSIAKAKSILDVPTQGFNSANINSNEFLSVDELTNIIKNRNSKKSAGFDGLPNYAIKKLSFEFIIFLTAFFNQAINSSHFPTAWKTANVLPVIKNGKNPQFINSYRPISQLSSLSKLLEKVYELKLRTFLTLNNLFDNHQFGFRAKHSTIHPVVKLLEDAAIGLNNKLPTLAVTLDFKAAFDTIWHKGLILKLHRNKVDWHIIKFIASYLNKRQYAVSINDDRSSDRNITSGAPQGSILSAILFLIYLVDFPKIPNKAMNAQRLLFADDVLIYAINKSVKAAQNLINKFLVQVVEYTNTWKLILNVSKCESMGIVGSTKDTTATQRKNVKNLKIMINGAQLENKNHIKYLGIILNKKLNFITHFDNVITKVNAARSMLRNIFNSKYVKSNVKLLAYKQLVRPLFLYGSAIWTNNSLVSSYQFERLRRLERSFLRKITNIYRNKHNNKYVNSKKLYIESKIDRIDRESIKANLKFIESCKSHENIAIKELVKFNYEHNLNAKYKSVTYLSQLNERNELFTNDKLLVFNRKKFSPNELIYVTNQ